MWSTHYYVDRMYKRKHVDGIPHIMRAAPLFLRGWRGGGGRAYALVHYFVNRPTGCRTRAVVKIRLSSINIIVTRTCCYGDQTTWKRTRSAGNNIYGVDDDLIEPTVIVLEQLGNVRRLPGIVHVPPPCPTTNNPNRDENTQDFAVASLRLLVLAAGVESFYLKNATHVTRRVRIVR